jgi:hypothetical protein
MWGAKPPTFSSKFCGRRAPFRPQNSAVSGLETLLSNLKELETSIAILARSILAQVRNHDSSRPSTPNWPIPSVCCVQRGERPWSCGAVGGTAGERRSLRRCWWFRQSWGLRANPYVMACASIFWRWPRASLRWRWPRSY